MAYSRRVYKREAEAAEKIESISAMPEPSTTPTYEKHVFGHKHPHGTNTSGKLFDFPVSFLLYRLIGQKLIKNYYHLHRK